MSDGKIKGNRSESDRLRPLFLAWSKDRTNSAVFRDLGIPYQHGNNWLSGRGVLRDEYQAKVREVLAS